MALMGFVQIGHLLSADGGPRYALSSQNEILGTAEYVIANSLPTAPLAVNRRALRLHRNSEHGALTRNPNEDSLKPLLFPVLIFRPLFLHPGLQANGSRLLGSDFTTWQFGNIVPGVFTPVLAKHSKSFSLIDCISVGVDRMQRNFEPMRKQVEAWQRSELTDVKAKVVIYEAFVEGKLEAPKHLARTVHNLYFEPKYEEFPSRTIWSLSNAFTSALKELEPIPQFKATAKLGEFLEARFSQAF
jgi:hypothetical protein